MTAPEPIPSELWVDLLELRGWVVVLCPDCGLGTDTKPDQFGRVDCDCDECGRHLCGDLKPWPTQRPQAATINTIDPRTDTWGT